jgi:hypothetical protein
MSTQGARMPEPIASAAISGFSIALKFLSLVTKVQAVLSSLAPFADRFKGVTDLGEAC